MKKIYLIILTLLVTVAANAQITTAVISGKVVDAKGVTMPGVTVSVLNTSTGTRYGSQTNADGRYTIPNVNPGGPYILSASFVGYKKDERTDVNLSLGSATYNFILADETTSLKEVKIVGNSGGTKNGASTRISQNQIKNMPSINRSLQDLTRATPQSNNNSFQGANYRYNNVTLDGAINNDAIGFSPSLGGQNNASGQVGSSTRTSPVSLDAIQDIQVLVAPYDIKIGNVLGGSINAVTRSGTNDFSGSVYGYGRGAFMVGPNNAKAASGGDGSSLPSTFHDYQTGIRLGFPIVKNKLFFFTNEEIARRQDPVIAAAGTAGSAQVLTLQDAINIKDKMASYGFDAGSYENASIFSRSNKYFNRLDWNINDKNQLTLRNNTISSTATNLERDQQNFRFSDIDYTSHNNSSSTVAELKTRFNNNLNNSLVVGYSNVHDYRTPNSNPALPQIEITGNTPGTTIFLGTDREAAIFDMRQKTTEFTDNLTYTKGKHTFTFGTHNEFYDITYNFVNAWNGRIAYSSVANFLANNPSRTRANYNYIDNTRDYILAHPSAQFKVDLLSFYGQDEIQLSDKFKLTAGVRFDYAGIPNKQPLSSKTTGAPVDVNYGNTFTYTKPADIKNNYLNNLEINPRVSFNYDINGDQSAILRGGSGLFTGRVPFAWFGYAFYNNGNTYGAYDRSPKAAAPITPGTNPVQAPANGGLGYVNQQNNPAANTGASGPTQVDLIDNHFKMPQVWRTNLAYDYQTDDKWKFTLEGIYTKVIHDLKFQQVNTVDSVTYYPYDVNKEQPIFVNKKVNPSYTNAYLLSNTNQGYRYSLTVQVAKQFPFGLNASVAYTYGHSKDVTNGIRNSMESNWQLNQALNPNNPGLANSNFDIRSRIVSNVNYVFNWDKAKNYTANFTFFLSAQTGNPYTYGIYPKAIDGTGQQVSLSYIPKTGETVNFFSDIAGGATAAQQAVTFDNYIDANKYLSSRRGKFTERNAAYTPWNNNLDFRFSQDFKFGSGKRKQVLTFTYDIINLTNLLNKHWGQYYFSANTFNSTASVGLTPKTTPAFTAVSTTYPKYTFTDPGVPYSVDLFASRWQMQFGLRYAF
ncbi:MULTISPECIES: carboxypeptidase regulatory-like domain-containing protein [unclassified Mucilaginibacter]|uniref:TonB-dependent receptor n=1 Tax=unclassified Mucilaginibacter TaxID=2617802 RepID=UPI002AC910B4|nr:MULTISPECIES: carboxypeptidase regulatory-like domain-containing protein [unclassified Mucilaginibacter]MEB0262515.1 carboxypeptidase regulatory-like domain-containing protein [Mucilaginibacter sp. 10I4]MEB0277996.1 carboxypeptidase regulatory-like domain-containing protein [Mucilaginibacter sp. 10B2]MEB0299651.1 carboxypeptidase regulatory-like domain-containing protein [Mucilaginibacter sp. 5C4]WPX22885.1 carboxypeptidase regulatory-like domain-containing protein [Mucilaginibacter sp. 5C4]